MKKKSIYFMGIAGTGMASVAGLLSKKGYQILGSDHDVYPPMSTMLDDLGIKVKTPYGKQNLEHETPDCIVVANCLSRGHEELEYAIERKIPLTSFPQIVEDEFLDTQKSIVVTGTHGKTTTTTMISYFLDQLGTDSSYLIGGIPKNLPFSFHYGKGPFFTIEGDEYDTAYFDKKSKFLHYKPFLLLLNNIEFDHADIFNNLDEIFATFKELILKVKDPRNIIANIDDPNVVKILSELNLLDHVTQVSSYGQSSSANMLTVKNLEFSREKNLWKAQFKINATSEEFAIYTAIGGSHNIANLSLAFAALLRLKDINYLPDLNSDKLRELAIGFKGVKRRLEHLSSVQGVEVYEDFAHHPTAVGKIIDSFKMAHPDKRLIVAFEPKNATSRRNIFSDEYAKVLKKADWALLGQCPLDKRIQEDLRMDTKVIAEKIGKHSLAFSNNMELEEWLINNRKEGDAIIFMSSSSFSGIPQSFCKKLEGLK